MFFFFFFHFLFLTSASLSINNVFFFLLVGFSIISCVKNVEELFRTAILLRLNFELLRICLVSLCRWHNRGHSSCLLLVVCFHFPLTNKTIYDLSARQTRLGNTAPAISSCYFVASQTTSSVAFNLFHSLIIS